MKIFGLQILTQKHLDEIEAHAYNTGFDKANKPAMRMYAKMIGDNAQMAIAVRHADRALKQAKAKGHI